jgi:hypothetical protein
MRFGFCFPVLMIVGAATAHAQDAKSCTPDPASTEKPILNPVEGTHHFISPPTGMMLRLFERHSVADLELDVHLLQDGSVDNINIVKSTRSRELDSYVADTVKRDWKWGPPLDPRTCLPVDAHSSIKMHYARNGG